MKSAIWSGTDRATDLNWQKPITTTYKEKSQKKLRFYLHDPTEFGIVKTIEKYEWHNWEHTWLKTLNWNKRHFRVQLAIRTKSQWEVRQHISSKSVFQIQNTKLNRNNNSNKLNFGFEEICYLQKRLKMQMAQSRFEKTNDRTLWTQRKMCKF